MNSKAIILSALLCLVMLTGCEGQQAGIPLETQAKASAEAKETEPAITSDSTATITANGTSCTVNGKGATFQGDTLTINAAGTYTLSGKLDGRLVVNAKNCEINLIFDNFDIKYTTAAPVYINKAARVNLTLVDGSENSITDGASYTYDDSEKSEPDAAFFSKSNLYIAGSGTLTVNAKGGCGIKSKDNLEISGGNITVDSIDHCIVGRDSLKISGGIFDLTTDETAVKTTNDEDTSLGNLEISGGDFRIKAKNNGIKAENTLTVSGGNITIEQSYEGFEARHINISGGISDITADDDGINASDGSGSDNMGFVQRYDNDTDLPTVNITGGTLAINAAGDGLDSNGSVVIDGGTVIVYGPTDGANSSLDFETSFTVNSGTLIALGSSQMLEMPDAGEQNVIVMNCGSVSAGEALTLTDANGNILLAVECPKTTQSLIFSSPELTLGETCTLSRGADLAGEENHGIYSKADLTDAETISEITVTDAVTSNGIMGGMGNMGGMHGNMPGNPGGPGGGMPGGPGGRYF